MWRRAALAGEFAALFLLLPLVFAWRLLPLPLIATLWLFAAVCLVVLLHSADFDRTRLWGARPLAGRAAASLAPLLLIFPALLVATYGLAPERLWTFVRERPLVWALVVVLYPVLSVYPQGIVYRVFIAHRYRDLLPARTARILASAVAFGMAHVILQNWIAPVGTFIGGLLFAWTYERTESAFWASVQHAACGCWLFTTGLGWYFYYGALTP